MSLLIFEGSNFCLKPAATPPMIPPNIVPKGPKTDREVPETTADLIISAPVFNLTD